MRRCASRRDESDRRWRYGCARPRAGVRHVAALRSRAVETLTAHGYEPVSDGGSLVLRNCPFHALAVEHTDLVCGINADLLGAFTDELAELDVEAVLAPAPGRCCVTLTKSVRRG